MILSCGEVAGNYYWRNSSIDNLRELKFVSSRNPVGQLACSPLSCTPSFLRWGVVLLEMMLRGGSGSAYPFADS